MEKQKDNPEETTDFVKILVASLSNKIRGNESGCEIIPVFTDPNYNKDTVSIPFRISPKFLTRLLSDNRDLYYLVRVPEEEVESIRACIEISKIEEKSIHEE
jgi:hypothetical protein